MVGFGIESRLLAKHPSEQPRNESRTHLLHLFQLSPEDLYRAMPPSEQVLDPEDLSAEERRALRAQITRLRDDAAKRDAPRLTLTTDDEGDLSVELPDAVARVLVDALADLAEGHPITVADADEELTTREAAELLNVSRPHLTTLLKDGAIPSHKVGSHHRVRRRDVLAYKAKRRAQSEDAMQRLTEKSQELGLGYE